MDILVTYDINTTSREGEIRLARIARICERYGVRVQYSVFECRVTETPLVKLLNEIEGMIDLALDSAHVCRFADTIQEARVVVGRPKPRELGEPWIL